MSTWQMLSGEGFRWELSGRIIDSEPNKSLFDSKAHILPSMADLLYQQGNTLFQTSSNNNVHVSSAGMAKARALLGLEKDKQDSHFKKVTSTKFQTASGKSLSVSADALKRARSLLGDPELGSFFDDNQFVTPPNDKRLGDFAMTNGNSNTADSFVSPLMSSSKQFRSVKLRDLPIGGNLIKKFDAAVDETVCSKENGLASSPMTVCSSNENGFIPRAKQAERPTGQPLVGITNRSDTIYANNKQESTQKKRMGNTISVSSFKRPRTSSFKTPLKDHPPHASTGLSSVDTLCSKKAISTRYQKRSPRVYINDYFGMHPTVTAKMNYVPDHVRRIKSSNAHRYVFGDVSTPNVIGPQALLQILVESGASFQHTSIKWVTNHYRWIVWKLACYEKYYPTKCRGKFLTVTNVLEELKYRYEREVNYGHCSAIKRILSGKASASSMMVLCISAINPKTNYNSHGCDSVKVELTDGWYSMNAALDVMLTKQLNAGKLFVGQKLRAVIANKVCLLLNINGTYRAHWADRLGFCKGVGVPLAFNCIKCNGGPVPKTIAGITRIYPILYKERLMQNLSVNENWRLSLIEGLMSEYQRGNNGVQSQNDTDSEEGAKIFKLLQTSAEPELLMADMSYEQLISFSKYRARLEAAREKPVAESLKEAGLCERDVSPFIRIKLVGLMSLAYEGERCPKEGIVTIWDPTETQLFVVNFREFYNPRKGIYLSDLDELPLSSEFDIAVYVVYVGDAYTDAEQKKRQWVFATDGSNKYSESGEATNNLLAISFTTPYEEDISFPHISRNLVGSVVGFCNLIKSEKDATNDMWVGEATENTAYFINAQDSYSRHLERNCYYIQTWANLSSSKLIIHKIGQRVAQIIGACK
ncbi:unnamed protein product [Cochlearia groenlandica]